MSRLLPVALCAALLTFASPAWGTQLKLRIEGARQTIFEGSVDTGPRVLDGGDGSGPHPCRGTDPDDPRPTPTTALADAAAASGFTWRGNWDPSFNDFFIDAIGPDASEPPTSYWGVLANGHYTAGGCTETVGAGDDVLWAYDTFTHPLILQLDGPGAAAIGETFTVRVSDWQEDADGHRFAPVAGASVGGQLTDANGEARLSFDQAGVVRLKAERADAIRSNALAICVGGCPGEPGPGGATPEPVPGDDVAVEIAKWHNGDRFVAGAGPRILRGRAAAGAEVEVTLTRRSTGGRGVAPMATRRWTVAASPDWTLRLPRPLAPARYALTATAAGQADRLRFRVAKGRSPRAASSAAARYARHALPRLLHAARHARRLPAMERTALALATPHSRRQAASATLDRLRRAIASRQRGDGSFAGDELLTAQAALVLSGDPRRRAAVGRAARRLLARQHPDGSFGPGAVGDAATTGAAIVVLRRTGASRTAISRAAHWLRSAQLPDGGFGTHGSRRSNARSTALAILAIRSLRGNPARLRTEDGITPTDLLRALQVRSGGLVYGSRADRTRAWVTALAAAAM